MEEESLQTIARSVESIAQSLAILVEKFGGVGEDNLNVTLYTDKPIQIENKKGE